MENGTLQGWNNDEYKNIIVYCIIGSENMEGFDWVLRDSLLCKSEVSFKDDFKRRKIIPYPLEKTYQDPTRVCYSPKFNPTSFRKHDRIVFDLHSNNIIN